jgi:uncharacterized membrane protein YedE/YeeE
VPLVFVGGAVFGVGWGLSGIWTGAAYASPAMGNAVMLYGIVGMFLGAYVQGHIREAVGGLDESAAPETNGSAGDLAPAAKSKAL